jgi:hypothetical protein
MQYMFPSLNGHPPASISDTAWPHAVAGHQTLFSPGWPLADADGLASSTMDVLNQTTYDR